MKKLVALLVALAAVAVLAAPVAAGPGGGKNAGCATLQQQTLLYSAGHYLAGQPLMLGFDPYGYNYQGHMFDGSYANAYLGRDGLPPYTGDDASYLAANPSAAAKWYWPYRNDHLAMKWDEAWLGNKDCNADGKLDRYYGYSSYIGSGAWLTNHMRGSYVGGDGKTHNWEDFVKIVAAPADANKVAGVWYTAGGSEIGPSIWGDFAIIQEVYNDPYNGDHGILYLSPTSAGLGYYAP